MIWLFVLALLFARPAYAWRTERLAFLTARNEMPDVGNSEWVLHTGSTGGRVHGKWRLGRRAGHNTTVRSFDPAAKIHTNATDFVVRHDSTLNPKKLRPYGSVLYADKVRYLVKNSRAIQEIAALPEVLGIWDVPRVFTRTFASAVESVAREWAGPGAVNTTVGIADTGLDVRHCSFFDSRDVPYGLVGVAEPASSGHAKIRAYMSVCTESSVCAPTDQYDARDGHGTHTSGILAGQPCFGMRGANPSAKMVFYDFQTGDDGLQMPVSIEAWLTSAKNMGVRWMSLSWGGGCSSTYADLSAQIDRFLWLNPEMNIVISAGNCGTPGSAYQVAYPATAKNVLSVGAVYLGADFYGGKFLPDALLTSPNLFSPLTAATFSSPGPMRDGRIAPLIAAPGVMITSSESIPDSPQNHLGFVAYSGTSMAAPYVPGAYLLDEIPDAPNYLVRALIVAGATPCTSTSTPLFTTRTAVKQTDDPAARCGYGSVVGAHVDTSWVIRRDTIAQQSKNVACYRVPAGVFNATLVWNDRDSLLDNVGGLIDALQLIVSFSDGSAIWMTDTKNNHKRVAQSFGTETRARVIIAAPNELDESPKPYALVLRGVAEEVSCAASCSSMEPAAPCPIPHGSGLNVCQDSGFVCLPQSCDDGYEMSGAACVLRNYNGDVVACSEHEHWNGTMCVCSYDYLCPNGEIQRCVGGRISSCDPEPATVPASTSNSSVINPHVEFQTTSTNVTIAWIFMGSLIGFFFFFEGFIIWKVANTSGFDECRPPAKKDGDETKKRSLLEMRRGDKLVTTFIDLIMVSFGAASNACFATGNWFAVGLYVIFAFAFAALAWQQFALIDDNGYFFCSLIAYDAAAFVLVSVPLMTMLTGAIGVLAILLIVFYVVFVLTVWYPKFVSSGSKKDADKLKIWSFVSFFIGLIALFILIATVASPSTSTDAKIATGVVLGAVTVFCFALAWYWK